MGLSVLNGVVKTKVVCAAGPHSWPYLLLLFQARHKPMPGNQMQSYNNEPPVWHYLHKILHNLFLPMEENQFERLVFVSVFASY